MRLPLTAVLSILGCSCLSQAAECYDQDLGPNCVAESDYGNGWCNNNFETQDGGWSQFSGPAGNLANIGKIGTFPSADTCVDAFNSIMKQCFSQKKWRILHREGRVSEY